jgi:hypothetical protein
MPRRFQFQRKYFNIIDYFTLGMQTWRQQFFFFLLLISVFSYVSDSDSDLNFTIGFFMNFDDFFNLRSKSNFSIIYLKKYLNFFHTLISKEFYSSVFGLVQEVVEFQEEL